MSTSSNSASGPGSASGSGPDNFPAFLEKTTAVLDALTTTAAGLPGKSDLAFHRTLDRRFGKQLDAAAEQVLGLTEKLLALVEVRAESSKAGSSGTSGTAGKVKTKARRKLEDEEDVVDGYRRGVVEVVDGLLEDADSNIDDLNGQKKKAAITVGAAALAAAGQKLPGPFNKTRERLPSHLYNAPNMPKPQLQFHDPINNSHDSPAWAPTLAHKHHAMVPLEFEAPLDDISDGESSDPSTIAALRAAEVQRRRHPYWFETQHIPYPTSMFVASQPIEPASFDTTPFQFVDQPEQLEQLVEKLKVAKEIAVDLEHHSARSYAGFTCLMQISTREGDWVVDTLKLRKELREHKLGGVLANPAIIKVFHGADSDIVWLQKDFDIYVVNLFDTFHATKVMDFQAHSLASLLSLYCNFTADKRYQMADWRIRPLDPDMLHYARADTHFLLYVYDNLRNALLDKSSRPPSPSVEEGETAGNSAEEQPKRRNPQQAMREVLDRSAETALKLYEREVYDPLGSGNTGWKALAKKWLPKGAVEEMPGTILRRLHAWRDKVAREEDEGPFYVITNVAVKDLSLLRAAKPNLVQRILAVRPMLAAQRAEEVVQVIQDAIDEYEAQGSLTHPPPGKSTDQSISSGITSGLPSTLSAKRAESTSNCRPAGRVSESSDDLWGRFAHNATKVSSKLFGQSLSSKSFSSPAGAPSGGTKAVSSLFGKAMSAKSSTSGGFAATNRKAAKNGKEVSPGFESVLQGIKDDLAPTLNGDVKDAEHAIEQHDNAANRKNTLPEPETVPYVPAGARSTVQAGAFASASDAPGSLSQNDSAPAQHEVKKPKKDEVVQVKRKQGKKRDRAITNGDIVGDVEGKKPKLEGVIPTEASSSSNATVPSELSTTGLAPTLADSPLAASPLASGAAEPGKASKKGKKKKVLAEDIPVFDYSQEGNLLDNSAAARKVEPEVKGKKKKDKRPKAPGGIMAIETPKFGKRAAKDMSQPKAGNKSGTFT